MNKLLTLLALPLMSGVAHATDWYVDGLNGHDGASTYCTGSGYPFGSINQPFKNFNCAMQHVTPGDTIHMLPTITYTALNINKSGTSTAPITITGDGVAPNLTKVTNGTAVNTTGYGIYFNAVRYVNVTKFDVSTPNPNGYRVVSGILANGSDHIKAMWNEVHDVGGNGISMLHSDWVTVSHNTVHDNGFDSSTGYFNSGISVLNSANTDTNSTNYKIVVASNIVYHNYNVPEKDGDLCGPSQTPCTRVGEDSDGHGIIMDRNDGSVQSGSTTYPPYTGKILIDNNITFNNGGRGIHVYRTNNVTIENNTSFLNNQDPYLSSGHAGEIEIYLANNCRAYNNIGYSDGKEAAIYGQTHNAGVHVGLSVQFSGGPVTADYNLFYSLVNDSNLAFYQGNNTGTVTYGTHNLWGDPLFTNASSDPSVADFHIQDGSPAIGTAYPPFAPSTNIDGMARSAVTPSMGAY